MCGLCTSTTTTVKLSVPPHFHHVHCAVAVSTLFTYGQKLCGQFDADTPPPLWPCLPQVVVGDRVILMPVRAQQPLHLSKQSISSAESINEVNALTESAPTCWRICLFMEGKEDKEDFLKAVGSVGCVV